MKNYHYEWKISDLLANKYMEQYLQSYNKKRNLMDLKELKIDEFLEGNWKNEHSTYSQRIKNWLKLNNSYISFYNYKNDYNFASINENSINRYAIVYVFGINNVSAFEINVSKPKNYFKELYDYIILNYDKMEKEEIFYNSPIDAKYIQQYVIPTLDENDITKEQLIFMLKNVTNSKHEDNNEQIEILNN